jgi:IclR family acetate operon transcriptional repressor
MTDLQSVSATEADSAAGGAVPTYPIGAVDTAMRVLRLLADHKVVRAAEVSRELGVARSTAHRMLQMLQYHGMVKQDPVSRTYSAGDELIRIGLAAVRQIDIRTVAHPILEELAQVSMETMHIVERRGDQVLILDSVEPPRQLRAGPRTGMSLPAHCTSTGKVLLCELSREQIRALYPQTRLPTSTPNSMTSRSEFEAVLAQVADRGYAVNLGESEVEIAAVAVPVRDPNGAICAALSASLPMSRVSDQAVAELVEQLKAGVRRIEAELAV